MKLNRHPDKPKPDAVPGSQWLGQIRIEVDPTLPEGVIEMRAQPKPASLDALLAEQRRTNELLSAVLEAIRGLKPGSFW